MKPQETDVAKLERECEKKDVEILLLKGQVERLEKKLAQKEQQITRLYKTITKTLTNKDF